MHHSPNVLRNALGPMELLAYRKGMAEHCHHSDRDLKQTGPLVSSDSTVSNPGKLLLAFKKIMQSKVLTEQL